jgi:predicted nucleic acid-binding protein
VRRFLYDTSIFVYALGSEHPYREPCRERGIEAILTTDRAFEGIDELERIDPADERTVASLVG